MLRSASWFIIPPRTAHAHCVPACCLPPVSIVLFCWQTPEPSSVLGLFNLSQMLSEDTLRGMLEKHGKLKSIMLIKDRMVSTHNTTLDSAGALQHFNVPLRRR